MISTVLFFKRELDKLEKENEELEIALEKIATFDPASIHGYVDEWEEAEAFRIVRGIARAVIMKQHPFKEKYKED